MTEEEEAAVAFQFVRYIQNSDGTEVSMESKKQTNNGNRTQTKVFLAIVESGGPGFICVCEPFLDVLLYQALPPVPTEPVHPWSVSNRCV